MRAPMLAVLAVLALSACSGGEIWDTVQRTAINAGKAACNHSGDCTATCANGQRPDPETHACGPAY